jgi:type IV pilus assembly protein PilB
MLSGEVFIQQGLIDEAQLEQALDAQRDRGEEIPIGRLLVELGMIQERDRVQAMGEIWGIGCIDVALAEPQPEALRAISYSFARRFRCLPLELENDCLKVAMANPMDVFVVDELRSETRCEIEALIAVEGDLEEAISRHYRQATDVRDEVRGALDDLGADITLAPDARDREPTEAELREMGEEAPIIRLANLIISQAIADGASDIHIEPRRSLVVVRSRVDGVMQEVMTLPSQVSSSLTSRFKILSNLDIAEKRKPQDSRISARVNGKEYDFRVSTLPVVYGEKIVMRVLDKAGISIGLAKLGFLPHNLKLLKDMASRSYGIVLVTGPTGSGKSTSLYSLLNEANDGRSNIITIEDPVEYELDDINQCSVNPRAGMTFAAGLRAMLRQDPDVIMVGEMRDHETATIAMEAALTGHLVFSTLHTNDAPGAATRLMEMGVEPFLISSAVVGVLAQRLVRVLCPHCKAEEPVSADMVRQHGFQIPEGLELDEEGRMLMSTPVGCSKCRNLGYRGRTGVHELMMMSDEIRDLILKREPGHLLRQAALRGGMKTLQDDAVFKVAKGATSLEEVVRVLYS